MNLSAIHKGASWGGVGRPVVCDIGGYEFVSYSQGYAARSGHGWSCL